VIVNDRDLNTHYVWCCCCHCCCCHCCGWQVVISLKATSEVIKPANVVLVAVVDKSGSMEGRKIELVRGTVDFLAEQLSKDDALGLVTYSDQVGHSAACTCANSRMTLSARCLKALLRCQWLCVHYVFLAGQLRQKVPWASSETATRWGNSTPGPCPCVFTLSCVPHTRLLSSDYMLSDAWQPAS
jgi:hypothetical protein